MRTRSKRQMSLVCAVLAALLAPGVLAAVNCGGPFGDIISEPEPVDIDCAAGNVFAYDSTVNILSGAHFSDVIGGGPGSGQFGSGGECTINVYGGQFDSMFSTDASDIVTIYAESVEPIPGILEDGQTQIINSNLWTVLEFDLVGVYQDGTPFSIPVFLGASGGEGIININVPQTAPDISVLPALLEWDLGDVEVGESTTMLVQIFNLGNADLDVSSVTLTGDASFSITAGPTTPLVVIPNPNVGVDFEVTFAPTAEGVATATVQIASDDGDEGVIEVVLSGVGVITEIPPSQQIQDILNLFDESIALGTMQGYGPGNSASKRVKALRNMIEAASDLIEAGATVDAIEQLESISKKTDGISKPQDFVVGEAVVELNAMIETLIADLSA